MFSSIDAVYDTFTYFVLPLMLLDKISRTVYGKSMVVCTWPYCFQTQFQNGTVKLPLDLTNKGHAFECVELSRTSIVSIAFAIKAELPSKYEVTR